MACGVHSSRVWVMAHSLSKMLDAHASAPRDAHLPTLRRAVSLRSTSRDECPNCRYPQIHALLNCVSSSVTAFLNTFSFLWHVCATVALCVGLLLTARHVNPPEYVLTTWTPHTDKHGKGAQGQCVG